MTAEDTPMEDRQSIVVGFDGSPPAVEALRWAVAESTIRGASVRVVQSWQDPAFADPVWLGELEDRGALERRALADLQADVAMALGSRDQAEVQTEVVDHAPTRLLVEASASAGMVVVGSRGRGGFATLLLGSVSHKVAGQARCPVVVVRSGPQGRDVVVGVDGSEPSRAALAWALDEAHRRRTPLRVLLAWNYLFQLGPRGPLPFRAGYRDADARAALHEIVTDVLGDAQLDVAEIAVCDQPAKALIRAGADAALLVVGPRATSLHARTGLGSVTDQVLHHAPCPVVVVHEPGTERDEG